MSQARGRQSALDHPDLRLGLRAEHFRCIGRNGLGDPLNAYPHAMSWFRGSLMLGTTRSNLCMLRVSKIRTRLETWPVECPENLYDQDMRAQIWRYDPTGDLWANVCRSPLIEKNGERLPRELGYRGMVRFKGRSDTEEALYVSTYAPARANGARILRSVDGWNFEEVAHPAAFGDKIIALRLLIPFKDRLFTSPTATTGGKPNIAGHAVVYETDDPQGGEWRAVNLPGFGDPDNLGIFEMIGSGDHLYAGTLNPKGYQVWRTEAGGHPPYRWERVVTLGAYRGPLNQSIASFCVHDGFVYAGGGIQHGGVDTGNGVGPAPPELIRIAPDGSWDLVVGRTRDTPDGRKTALSGLPAGFGNFFAGYFWRMESHDGWLYVGSFDWSLMMRYANRKNWPAPFRAAFERVGIERVIEQISGADLYRSRDGENWMAVTNQGFGNPYNYGIRTMQSTPAGLAVGMVNPFAPRVAVNRSGSWEFVENPDGGMEIWLGSRRTASDHSSQAAAGRR